MNLPARTILAILLCTVLTAGCGLESRTPPDSADNADGDSAIAVHSLPPYGVSGLRGGQESAADEGRGMVAFSDSPQENAFRMAGSTPEIWRLGEWANSDPIRWNELRGKVVVVRFFDLDSEACERSMKAMQQLHEEYSGRPAMFLGVYRTSPDNRGAEWQTVVDQIDRWGITFPVARDRGGVTLQRWWHRYFDNVPDTPAFVIGPDGRVVHVQPGPEFHPSEDLMFALCNRDFLAVREAIQTALPQDVARRTTGTEAVADVP